MAAIKIEESILCFPDENIDSYNLYYRNVFLGYIAISSEGEFCFLDRKHYSQNKKEFVAFFDLFLCLEFAIKKYCERNNVKQPDNICKDEVEFWVQSKEGDGLVKIH